MVDIISQADYMGTLTGKFLIRPQTEWEVRAKKIFGAFEYESWEAAEADLEEIQRLAAQLYRDWLMLEPVKNMGEVWARINALVPGMQKEIRISTNVLGYGEFSELYQELTTMGFNVQAVEGCFTCPKHDWSDPNKFQQPHQMLIYKPISANPRKFDNSYHKYPHL